LLITGCRGSYTLIADTGAKGRRGSYGPLTANSPAKKREAPEQISRHNELLAKRKFVLPITSRIAGADHFESANRKINRGSSHDQFEESSW
jgi:hypothetical protein